jgi:hypothetical protein
MRTLEVPIEIEVHEGCASATPVLPPRERRTPRRSAPRSIRATAQPCWPSETEAGEALQLAGALPADIVIG